MRFVILQSFDASDVYRTFEADVGLRIAAALAPRNGKIFQAKPGGGGGEEEDDDNNKCDKYKIIR